MYMIIFIYCPCICHICMIYMGYIRSKGSLSSMKTACTTAITDQTGRPLAHLHSLISPLCLNQTPVDSEESEDTNQSAGISRLIWVLTVCTCLNPIALRTPKTLWSFGLSECKELKRILMWLICKYALHMTKHNKLYTCTNYHIS